MADRAALEPSGLVLPALRFSITGGKQWLNQWAIRAIAQAGAPSPASKSNDWRTTDKLLAICRTRRERLHSCISAMPTTRKSAAGGAAELLQRVEAAMTALRDAQQRIAAEFAAIFRRAGRQSWTSFGESVALLAVARCAGQT